MLSFSWKKPATAALIAAVSLTVFACGGEQSVPGPGRITSLSDLPAVRLNYKYEADVPPPELDPATTAADERFPTIQADFDATRPLEVIERTVLSPDKKHVAVIHRRISDTPGDFRLDMYSPDGQMQRRVSSDAMAVRFPETLRWSPDSSSFAFVAMTRAVLLTTAAATPTPEPVEPPPTDGDGDPEPTPAEPIQAATPQSPTGILTFRTEQIYISTADGSNVRPVTNTEGLIYFYYGWSPDGSRLTALAVTLREFKYYEQMANGRGEQYIPQGRPRVIEKNGRERRLDDALTAVRPVWSPDSTKIAAAYGNQIRIYDSGGTNPTQAAIPLRNQLLMSSQAYDQAQGKLLDANPQDTNSNASPTPRPTFDETGSTLPDEKLLVSYNPIVELLWTNDNLLYFKTAYIRSMINSSENVQSFARWHRLPLSAQVEPDANKQ